MKAVTYSAYGPLEGLQITDVAQPRPQGKELLVRVTHAALNPKDALLRAGAFRMVSGSRFPKLCGLDFAGIIEESGASNFARGQRVFGMLNEWRLRRGSLAEYLVCKECEAAPLPKDVSGDSGAAIALVGLTALQALRDIARVQAGMRLLIHGASGGVGTVAIQIARVLGAEVETTSSPGNFDLCHRLGASKTWDYVSSALADSTPHFDVVFDVFGDLDLRRSGTWLEPKGIFISAVPTVGKALRDLLTRLSSVQERLVIVRQSRADLDQLARWMKDGRLQAVIDSHFSLTNVQDAFRLLESRRTRGKIVVAIVP